MKKIFAVLAAVVFLCMLTGPASAGGIKPPKSICLLFDPGPGALFLGIKKGNKFEYGSQKINMYTVQGVYIPLAVYGTGYMQGDLFVCNISTSMQNTNYDMQVLWDVVNETGEVYINETTDGALDTLQYTLIQIDCDTL